MRLPAASSRVMSGKRRLDATGRRPSGSRRSCAASARDRCLRAARSRPRRRWRSGCRWGRAPPAPRHHGDRVRLAGHVGDDGLGPRQAGRDLFQRPGAPAGNGDGRAGPASVRAMAAPMPVPPPVISACWPSSSRGHHTLSAAGSARAASRCSWSRPGQVGLGPGLARVAERAPRRAASSRDRPDAAARGSTGRRGRPSGSS